MTFLRPEALGVFRRWGEAAAALAVTAFLAWNGVRDALAGASLGWIMGAGAVLALFWLRAAVLRALAHRPAEAPGVVFVREGEIGFVGPGHGAVIGLDAIARVELFRLSALDEPMWRLVARDGSVLLIPANARGADALPGALSALPGFSDLAAVRLLASMESGRRVLWQRPGLRPVTTTP